MATGTYHKFNFLKFRILEALFDAYPASLTCKVIADNGDIELKKVADALNRYIAGNYSYITRLKKKSNEGKYRCKINTSGAEAYLQYKHRIKLGFDFLNISMRKIDRVKKRFVEEGLEVALNGEKRDSIYAKKVDGDFEAHLVALSCSEPLKVLQGGLCDC